MSNISNAITARLVNRIREKNVEKGKEKEAKYSTDSFECSGDVYSIVFVICGVIFALITVFAIISMCGGNETAGIGVFFFGVVTLLTFFAGWATAHHRLTVEENRVTYVNVWGIKKTFLFSELTKCLTTEQTFSLYIGDKKVAMLDKDMYGVDLFEARCKKDGITWGSKSRAGITKFSLVWHATRTIALIFFWAAVGISLLMIVVEITSGEFNREGLIELLEIELIIVGFFAAFIVIMMLFIAIGLKEVIRIERALGISFREEMAKRGARGREYRDEEWYIESVPTKIEVLNRRFIKQWHGIKADEASGANTYHVEFTDINGKRRKVGGHYKENAEKMNHWYYSGI